MLFQEITEGSAGRAQYLLQPPELIFLQVLRFGKCAWMPSLFQSPCQQQLEIQGRNSRGQQRHKVAEFSTLKLCNCI